MKAYLECYGIEKDNKVVPFLNGALRIHQVLEWDQVPIEIRDKVTAGLSVEVEISVKDFELKTVGRKND